MSNALQKEKDTIVALANSVGANRERNRLKRLKRKAQRKLLNREAKLGTFRGDLQDRGRAARRIQSDIQRLRSTVSSNERKTAATVRDILETLAFPTAERAIRGGVGSGSSRTALAQAHAIIDTPWTNSATSPTSRCYFDNSDSFAACFADPRRAFIYYDPNPTSKTWWYQCMYTNSVQETGAINTFNFNNQEYPKICMATGGFTSTTYLPHGKTLWPGQDEDGNTFIWIDSPNGSSNVHFGGLSATTTQTLHIIQWQEGETSELPVETVTNPASGAFIWPVPESGYYNFNFSEATGISTNQVTCSFSGTCSVMCHREMTDFTLEYRKIIKGAMLSCSLMYSNRAASDFVPGQNIISQQDGNVDWMTIALINNSSTYPQVPSAVMNNLRSCPQHQWRMNEAKNGAFAFLKPENILEQWRLKSMTQNPAIGGNYSTGAVPLIEPYPLNSADPYLVVTTHTTPAASGSAVTNLQDGMFTFQWCLEYTTGSTWVEQDMGLVQPTIIEDAVFGLKMAPQFHDNPFHFMDIINFARENIFPIASQILGAAASVAPPQAKIPLMIASGVSGYLSKEKKTKSQTTSQRNPRSIGRRLYVRP